MATTQGPAIEALRRVYADLVEVIQDPHRLACQLLSKEIVGWSAPGEMLVLGIPVRQMTMRLLEFVKSQIATNPAKLREFVDVLKKEPPMVEVAVKLETVYLSLCAQQSKPTPTQHLHEAARQAEAGNHDLEPPPPKMKEAIFHQPSTSAIELYASYLKSVYVKQKLPMYDKLPQIKGKKYIELALIGKDDITPEEADEFTRATIHGNLHDITRKKQPMTFHEIAQLEDGSQPKCILIEGAPGIGKSTFSWKLCRKWGKGKILQQYKVFVMLRLRDNRVRQATDVLHLFRHPDMDTQEAAAKEIARRRGKGLLLLLEGFDELPSSLRTERSLFMKIITGLELPEATVMITSRLSASSFLLANCRDNISQHIEIIGFSLEDVQSYLMSAFEDAPSLHSGLQDYLSCYPHMQSMMYVPLNCAIVAQVYRNSIKDKFIPKTMSDLYTSLVRSLLLRYLHDHPVHGRKVWRLRSFSDLPPDVFQQLCELGRIAYEGIVQGQQVIFSDLPSDFDGLGLMQSMNELYVDEGTAVSFSFFHLTLQEYMAALHLSEQPVERQIKHFQEYGHKVRNLSLYDQFIVVLQFLAGLKKFQEYPTDSIRSILTNTCPSITASEPGSNGSDGEGSASDDSDDSTSELQITLDGLHWIFESQGTSSISEAIGMLTVDPQLHYRRLSAFDCFVLGYCVSHSNCPWDLNLEDCCIGDEEIELLVRGALEGEPSYSGYISALTLWDNQITSSGLNQLGKLQKLLNLNKLDLSLNPLGNGGAATLLQSSVAHVFKDLSLWRTGIGAEDCRALGELLSSSPRLEYLNVSGNDLTPEAIQLMFSGLQHNTTLQELRLNSNPLGSGGVVPLLKSGVAPNLRSLFLANTGIGEEDCRMLSQLLSSSTRLEELDISRNSLTPMAIEFLVSGLQHNTTLDTLYIEGNSLSGGAAVSLLKSPLAHRLCRFSLTVIGEEDSRAVGELLSSSQNLEYLVVGAGSDVLPPEAVELIITGLQHNTGLEELDMWYVPFSLHNCTSLASVLRHHPLELLRLYDCSVDADGASELAKTLVRNNTLQTLDLEGNPIDVRGAAAFADILPHNTALKDLLLSDESIGPEGTQLLIDSLTSNIILLRLTLPGKYESSVSTNITYRRERGRIRWKQNTTLQELPSNEEEHRLLAAVEEIMKKEKTIEQTIVQCLFIGPPRNGKSSFMRRLLGEGIDDSLPLSTTSTGVAENARLVGIKGPSTLTVELSSGLPWGEISFDAEVMKLMQDVAKSVNEQLSSEISTPSSAESKELSESSKSETQVHVQPATIHALSAHELNQNPDVSLADDFVESMSTLPASSSVPNEPKFKTRQEMLKHCLKKGWSEVKKYFEGTPIMYLTDTGGQIEFQELLSVLVSGPSVFFLVFRLDWNLNTQFDLIYADEDKVERVLYKSTLILKDALLQSLASIASMFTGPRKKGHTQPKVLFIGTHKDELKMESEEKKEEKIRQIDEELQSAIKFTSFYTEGLVQFAKKDRLIFTVNNLSGPDSDFICIRKAVENVVRQNHFKVEVPGKWLFFSLLLRQQDVDEPVISYEQCSRIASECGIHDLEEALWFLSTKFGLIRHFRHKDLSQIVIRNPKILFDGITQLIIESFTFENQSHCALNDFKCKGLFLLSDFTKVNEKVKSSLLTASNLVDVLRHLHIIAPIHKPGEGERFFMPCILSHAPHNSQDYKTLGPPLLVCFRCGYCPKGFFSCLVAYLLDNSRTKSKKEWILQENKIFKNQVSFTIRSFQCSISLKLTPFYIEVLCISNASSNDSEKIPVGATCTEARTAIKSGIHQVTSDLKYEDNAYFAFYCECPCGDCKCKELHGAEFDVKEPSLLCRHVCQRVPNLPIDYDNWFPQASRKRTLEDFGDEESSNARCRNLREDGPNTSKKSSNIVDISEVDQTPLDVDDDLYDVVKKVSPVAARWKAIGRGLRLKTGDLETIAASHLQDPEACLSEMLTLWLKKNYNVKQFGEPTWQRLVEVVADATGGANRALAEKIAKKYKLKGK